MVVVVMSNRELWIKRIEDPLPWALPILFATIGFLIWMGFQTFDYYNDRLEVNENRYGSLKRMAEEYPKLLPFIQARLKDDGMMNIGEWDELSEEYDRLEFEKKRHSAVNEILEMDKPKSKFEINVDKVVIIENEVWKDGRKMGELQDVTMRGNEVWLFGKKIGELHQWQGIGND